MFLYEFVFLIRQDASQTQVQTLMTQFKECIEAGNGTVTKEEYCGLRSLAYRIKKNKKAHYVLFNVDAPSQALDELERQMRLHEDVLRYLRVRVEKLDPNPSALVQARHYRDRGEYDEGDNQRQTKPSDVEADEVTATA